MPKMGGLETTGLEDSERVAKRSFSGRDGGGVCGDIGVADGDEVSVVESSSRIAGGCCNWSTKKDMMNIYGKGLAIEVGRR